MERTGDMYSTVESGKQKCVSAINKGWLTEMLSDIFVLTIMLSDITLSVLVSCQG